MKEHIKPIALKNIPKIVIMGNKKGGQIKDPKIVVDTNLLVAAFFNKKSSSFKILEMAEKGRVRLLWTKPIRSEARSILGNIKQAVKSKMGNHEILKNIFKKENKINNPPKLDVVKEDSEDNKFLSCALKGGAKMIVSNDQHLLKIGEFRGIVILTSTEAVKKLQTIN